MSYAGGWTPGRFKVKMPIHSLELAKDGAVNDSIYLDADIRDDQRRAALFEGQLFVYSPSQESLALVDLARGLIKEHFGDLDPETAQHHMPVEEYAELLGRLKPAFIHHLEAKRLMRALFDKMGVDSARTYADVPKMRTATSDGYLTTGIAYAWHPHRDTWFSAPASQINWWVPIYPIRADNCMAFHPPYFTRAVDNDSLNFNYYEWNQYRGAGVAAMVKKDSRPIPRPTKPIASDPQIRLVVPVGGLIMFSAHYLHSSVPNTSGVTRYSFDFRTVHLDDLLERRGAPNLDSACTGTALRDFWRCTDQARLPEDLIARYDDGSVDRGLLVYNPEAMTAE